MSLYVNFPPLMWSIFSMCKSSITLTTRWSTPSPPTFGLVFCFCELGQMYLDMKSVTLTLQTKGNAKEETFTCNSLFHHQVVLGLCQSSLSRWLHYGIVTRELARHDHRTRNCLSSHQGKRMWRDSFNPNQPLHNSLCNHKMFLVFSP